MNAFKNVLCVCVCVCASWQPVKSKLYVFTVLPRLSFVPDGFNVITGTASGWRAFQRNNNGFLPRQLFYCYERKP